MVAKAKTKRDLEMRDLEITGEYDAVRNVLILTVPCWSEKEAPLSSSGKSHLRASTGGFQSIAGLRVSLNVIS